MIYKACLIVPSRLPLYIIYCTFEFLFLLNVETFSVLGADLILYPTAIGSEPTSPEYDSSAHWERVMVGHSAANMIPIVATNRVGMEKFSKSSITFYGCAFLNAIVSCVRRFACFYSIQIVDVVNHYLLVSTLHTSIRIHL